MASRYMSARNLPHRNNHEKEEGDMSFASSLRSLLSESFLKLPFVLSGWAFFMGMVQGNVALLVLFLGMALAVPFSSFLLNKVAQFLSNTMGLINIASITVPASDVCRLIPLATGTDATPMDAAPTTWLAQIVFFFTFLITNAVSLYNRKAQEGSDPQKVAARQYQAAFSVAISGAFFALFLVLRVFYVGCETVTGILVALVAMGALGYGWYNLAEACSARDADMFGIVQKILPLSALQEPPMTCVYQPTDKTDT